MVLTYDEYRDEDKENINSQRHEENYNLENVHVKADREIGS